MKAIDRPATRTTLLLLLSCITLQQLRAQQERPRPNIIVFLIDDMGWEDTSVPFSGSVTDNNKKFRTPNMERLARNGTVFTDAYAAPVCTPTRVSLISGMNVAHHKVTNWTSPFKDTYSDAADTVFAPAAWNANGVSAVAGTDKAVHATLLPQLLQEAGYFTIHVGKAHWGPQGTPGANPHNLGFIVNVAGHAAGHPQSYLSEDNYGNLPGKNSAQSVPDLEEYYQSGNYLTEALTRETLKALDFPVARKQPFFLNFAHYAVHVPLMADKRYYEAYLARGLDSLEAKYASMIEGMDKSLGDVLDYLDKKGIRENTVVLFLSDNGGLALVPPKSGTPFTHNAPLRAGKGSVYEGGIRIPFIVSYPGHAKADAVIKSPVIVEDVFPSLLELAGVKDYKTVQSVDGRSFVPALSGVLSTDSSRALLWHFPNKWKDQKIPGTNYFSALRQGRWKLVYDQVSRKAELYDLATDLSETNDLAASNPAKTAALLHLLGTSLKNFGSPMPVRKATGKTLPYPGESR